MEHGITRLISSGHSNTEFIEKEEKEEKRQGRKEEIAGGWKVSGAVSTSRHNLAVQFPPSLSPSHLSHSPWLSRSTLSSC